MTFDEFTVVSLPSRPRFAVVLTGDRGPAEDVTQEVLVRVHLRWAKIADLLGCGPGTIRGEAPRARPLTPPLSCPDCRVTAPGVSHAAA